MDDKIAPSPVGAPAPAPAAPVAGGQPKPDLLDKGTSTSTGRSFSSFQRKGRCEFTTRMGIN